MSKFKKSHSILDSGPAELTIFVKNLLLEHNCNGEDFVVYEGVISIVRLSPKYFGVHRAGYSDIKKTESETMTVLTRREVELIIKPYTGTAQAEKLVDLLKVMEG